MAKSNQSRFAIMGMLALTPRSSGYDLKKLMEGSTDYFWKESYGSIYPVLSTLIKEGMVTKEENLSTSARQKHVYTLTAQGKKVLKEWMSQPVEYEQARNELLLKLFFGKLAPSSTTRKHVEKFYQTLLEKYETYQVLHNQLQDQKGTAPPYYLMTLDFGLRQVKSALDWCESVLKQYDQLEQTNDV